MLTFSNAILAALFIHQTACFLQSKSQIEISLTSSVTRKHFACSKKSGTGTGTNSVNERKIIPSTIYDQILPIAFLLWNGEEIPCLNKNNNTEIEAQQGEAVLPEGIDFSDRARHFLQEAKRGCPKAQHSIALLLWNEYGGVEREAVRSAKWHAAAAIQGHLDGMALLGGILRTGTGLEAIVPKKKQEQNVSLGLQLIDYCAQMNNPTGVNKKAALLEIDEDHEGAFHLYQDCYDRGNTNALLKLNLGWCWINGIGVVRKDAVKGEDFLRGAVEMAPDEGSEEAAWYLYQQYIRENPKVANLWFDIATKLGYKEE